MRLYVLVEKATVLFTLHWTPPPMLYKKCRYEDVIQDVMAVVCHFQGN